MNEVDFHGAYNAKWLTPTQVAKRFIPLPQFQRLVNYCNSILLGPRGSGKTTLLKMLTRAAIETWHKDRRDLYQINPFEYPDFEAVYVPADYRWMSEIKSIEDCDGIDDSFIEVLQRVIISASILRGFVDALKSICADDIDSERKYCSILRKYWSLKEANVRFYSLHEALESISIKVRSLINLNDLEAIGNYVLSLPNFYYAAALDAPLSSIRLLTNEFPKEFNDLRWALCFDELEIAPDWLREDIYNSLRSLESQNIVLKLTCSPILPSGLKNTPTPNDDFTAIRLWHSHIQDAKGFSENLARSFLKAKLNNDEVTPEKFFGATSMDDLKNEGEIVPVYDRDSDFYKLMISMAKNDIFLKKLLIDKGVDPNDPYSDSTELKDKVLRKIKPILLLRSAFISENTSKMRSRKLSLLYSGKDAIYAMSEANPRWLLGLLTDLCDAWIASANKPIRQGVPYMRKSDQAKILGMASLRFKYFLTAIGIEDYSKIKGVSFTIWDFIKSLGFAFEKNIYDKKLTLDPVNSFWVDRRISENYINIIRKAVDLGALVYIGKTDYDVTDRIEGGRFRITFMLSPIFRLPFRNYKEKRLSSLLANSISKFQLEFFN